MYVYTLASAVPPSGTAGGTNNDRSNGVVLQRSDILLCGVVCVCIVTLLHPVSHQLYGESQDCSVCRPLGQAHPLTQSQDYNYYI